MNEETKQEASQDPTNDAAEEISGASSGQAASPAAAIEPGEEDVARYLRGHPEFFANQLDLLADLTLPHESGKAISLLERQVTLLRERGTQARDKLNNLIENARSNDQLFDTTRSLVLALLRADNITEIAEATQDQLANHNSIDVCEVLLLEDAHLNVAKSVRTAQPNKMKQDFKEVFRLKRTFCGPLEDWQLEFLFPEVSETIQSTALCPVVTSSDILAVIAFGSREAGYFNVNLDTLFLDFIGHVVGAILDKQLRLERQAS